VVVRRVPAKSTATSLISRINNLPSGNLRQSHQMGNSASDLYVVLYLSTHLRRHLAHAHIYLRNRNRNNDIVINVKAEDAYSPTRSSAQPTQLTRQVSEVATSAVLADEEAEALKAISAADKYVYVSVSFWVMVIIIWLLIQR
jgi:hypothetical protein